MKLTDIFKGRKQLAEPEKRARRPKLNSEAGVSGDYSVIYKDEETRAETRTIEDYRRMRTNDGTAQAMYNILTWPILAAGYHFEGAEGGNAELELVEDNFMRPPHEGGMSLPFDLLIADMCRGLEDGFRLYNRVWTIDDQKRVLYRKLAPRDAATITLRRDENGGFNGAAQKTWVGNRYVDITLDVEECFLYTVNKERSFLYGESVFKGGYYHYDRKHKLYYLQQLGAEAAAVPPRKVKVPASIQNDEDKLNQVQEAAENFGTQQVLMYPEGIEVDEYKTNPMDLQKAIEHHDTLMARSILAQFLVLGSGETGSFALSKDQSDIFTKSLQGLMKQIENHINYYLIPPLVAYNFTTPKFPVFRFNELDESTKTFLNESFKQILTREDLPGYVIEGIAKNIAEELGIEIPKTDNKKESLSDKRATKELADNPRKPTEAERRANVTQLNDKRDKAVQSAFLEAKGILESIKEDAIARAKKLLDKKDISALKDFTLAPFTPYRKALEAAMMEQYLFGKRTAADEGGDKIPQTPKQSRDYITEQARAIAEKQEQDLLFAVKSEITKELRTANLSTTELSIADVLARIGAVWAAFEANKMELGIDIALAGSFNLGRNDTFDKATNIAVMQFSAIRDSRTTQLCKSLDGKVLSYEEYKATRWIPPLHFLCRSMWVAIYKDDTNIPDLDPIPAEVNGQTGPQLMDLVKVIELSEKEQQHA